MGIEEYIKGIFNNFPSFLKKWGVDTYIPIMPSNEHDGGLALRVNTDKFVGEISITLNYLDLFDVIAYKDDYTDRPLLTVRDIHVNDLVYAVDDVIKRVENGEPVGINESILVNMLTEELNKSDVINIIKKDKDVENRIKDIVRVIVKDMYRILYQHNDIFKALGK